MKPSIDNFCVINEAYKNFRDTLETDEQKEAFVEFMKRLVQYIDRIAAAWSTGCDFTELNEREGYLKICMDEHGDDSE